MLMAGGHLWEVPIVCSWRAQRTWGQGVGPKRGPEHRDLQGCASVVLELGVSRTTVLITCSLSFYKLQIRINYFMESVCKMQSIKRRGWRLPGLWEAWIQHTNLHHAVLSVS